MAQVLPEMNSDRRRKFMKKRSIGILLLGLAVCTCISGCGSQSIADVNEKSIQAEEETETKDEKKDVVIKKPEDSTKPLLREQAAPLSKGNRLLSRNETATYRGIEITVVDVLVAEQGLQRKNWHIFREKMAVKILIQHENTKIGSIHGRLLESV